MARYVAIVLLWLCGMPPTVAAGSGHGPVFGAATPTLGKGGWSFDQAWMGSQVLKAENDQVLRSMLGFGITEDLQLSVSLPIELSTSGQMPMGRMMAMMSSRREAEVLAGWRVHTRPVGDSARVESTIYVGGTTPLESTRAGLRTAPSLSVSAATGYASRTHYFWVGGSYQRPFARGGDRLGDIKTYSVVYGYRPRVLRVDYPKPDLRFFVETVGETTGAARHGDVSMPGTGGHTVMTGPTALLLYKAYGLSGGVLFPVYRDTGAQQARERTRFAVNVSYFFWLK
jgi:hypothetical protein